jgi:hypothetical protein
MNLGSRRGCSVEKEEALRLWFASAKVLLVNFTDPLVTEECHAGFFHFLVMTCFKRPRLE